MRLVHVFSSKFLHLSFMMHCACFISYQIICFPIYIALVEISFFGKHVKLCGPTQRLVSEENVRIAVC